MDRRFKQIAWTAGTSSLRNTAPKVLSGNLLSRFSKVFSISLKQGDVHGDDSAIVIGHFERKANEPIAIVIYEAADLNRVGSIRGDHDLSHQLSFRGDSAQPTIAEGGAAVNPVLDSSSRRAPGGPL